MQLRLVLYNLFIQLFIVWLVFGFFIIYFYSSKDLHLSLNQYHHSFFDEFFRYLTYFGDGVSAVIISLIIFFFNKKNGIIITLSWVISSVFTQVLKRLIYYDAPRPFKYFEGIYELYLVPGVEMNSLLSFPSGHATTSFALYGVIALLSGRKSIQIVLFTFAALCAYSRVYLSQHFFIDIFIGSIIGTLGSVIIFNFSRNLITERWSQPLISKK